VVDTSGDLRGDSDCEQHFSVGVDGMTLSHHMDNGSPTDSAFKSYLSQKPENKSPSVDHQTPCESKRSGGNPGQEGSGGVNGRDTERIALERAGWERIVHEGETVWRNPVSGYVYPQGIAISMLREGADPDVPFGPEGGA
jgi:hypothetical protein